MNWYCIHTRPQREAQVQDYLTEQLGLETYYPRLKQHKTIRRVRREVTGPLFPRYFFARFDLAVCYRAVRYAPEVIDVVSFGGRPAAVASPLIDGLKEWAGEAVDVLTLQPDLRPGDRVEIRDGPMRGLQAIILQEHSDRDRIAVMLSILEGKEVHLRISRSQLTRLP